MMCEPWTYCQAIAFLAYGSIDVAARYGGPDNYSDGGAARRLRDEMYPLASGLPGFEAGSADQKLSASFVPPKHALPPPKVTISSLGDERDPTVPMITNGAEHRDAAGPVTQEADKLIIAPQMAYQVCDPRQDADEQRWLAVVKRLYQALLKGSVIGYRQRHEIGEHGLIDPVPAEDWKQGVPAVVKCYFVPSEVMALGAGRSPSESDAIELRPASVDAIRDAMTAVYDEAKQRGNKPPNVKEVVAPVKERLKGLGLKATDRGIAPIGREDAFGKLRLRAGERP
jgi:hypothetical protein